MNGAARARLISTGRAICVGLEVRCAAGHLAEAMCFAAITAASHAVVTEASHAAIMVLLLRILHRKEVASADLVAAVGLRMHLRKVNQTAASAAGLPAAEDSTVRRAAQPVAVAEVTRKVEEVAAAVTAVVTITAERDRRKPR